MIEKKSKNIEDRDYSSNDFESEIMSMIDSIQEDEEMAAFDHTEATQEVEMAILTQSFDYDFDKLSDAEITYLGFKPFIDMVEEVSENKTDNNQFLNRVNLQKNKDNKKLKSTKIREFFLIYVSFTIFILGLIFSNPIYAIIFLAISIFNYKMFSTKKEMKKSLSDLMNFEYAVYDDIVKSAGYESLIKRVDTYKKDSKERGHKIKGRTPDFKLVDEKIKEMKKSISDPLSNDLGLAIDVRKNLLSQNIESKDQMIEIIISTYTELKASQ